MRLELSPGEGRDERGLSKKVGKDQKSGIKIKRDIKMKFPRIAEVTGKTYREARQNIFKSPLNYPPRIKGSSLFDKEMEFFIRSPRPPVYLNLPGRLPIDLFNLPFAGESSYPLQPPYDPRTLISLVDTSFLDLPDLIPPFLR